MGTPSRLLVCWHSERAGIDVLVRALAALRNRNVLIDRVLYLVQENLQPKLPTTIENVTIEVLPLQLTDPTKHVAVYALVRDTVLPRLLNQGEIHINISPGTPAMHAVWIVLHAGGSLPVGARLWSSQIIPETQRTRIDPVDFPLTTYLAEVHHTSQLQPSLAIYEPEARSTARRRAFEKLARYAHVGGAPLLILGERGTGKTRLVETLVASLKQRKTVITVACGGLDSTLAESFLFGHKKGAFTSAAADRPGVLKEADGGILFLDEVQDLPQTAQRKLVRVFQDQQHRFRPVGSDAEIAVDVELVCASNLELSVLREKLDADLFDRISHLTITIPPLRECREDLIGDWGRTWKEQRRLSNLPVEAPQTDGLTRVLQEHQLPGNLRDLQRLAVLLMAWWPGNHADVAVQRALDEWLSRESDRVSEEGRYGSGTRKERAQWFLTGLARWAKERFGTWGAAAKELDCDEKTLRTDANYKKAPTL